MRNLLTTLLLALLLPAALAQCTASFQMSLPPGALANTAVFTSTSTFASATANPVVGWNFGDGTTDTGAVVTHVFPYAGTFQLCITVFDPATGCSNQQCQLIQVGSVNTCSSYYYATPTGLTVDFWGILQDASGNVVNATSYIWDYGDGSPLDTTYSPWTSHVYPGPNIYVAYLTATDTVTGCTANNYGWVTVTGPAVIIPCDPTFSWYESNFGQVYFYPTAIGYTTDSIDFGDGSSQLNGGTTSTHLYLANGTYNVCRYVTDTAANCSDTFCTQVVVQYALASPCYASFYGYNNGFNPLQMDFTGYYFHLQSGNTTALSYVWDFGDGTQDSTSGSVASHSYAVPGLYTVCMTATDSSGCTSSACNQFTTTGFVPAPTFCDASFLGYETGAGQAFFSPYQTGYSTDTWDFGDGSAANSLDPLYPFHTYSTNGVYTVCHIVTDTILGCADTACETIIVNMAGQNANGCVSYHTYNIDSTNSLHYLFTGLHSNPIYPNTSVLKWEWQFGDGTIDTTSGATVDHTFAYAGVYPVCLTTTDSSGCMFAYCDYLNVAGGISYGNVTGQVTAGTTPLDYGTLFLVTVDPLTQLLYVIDSTFLSPADSGMYGFNAVVSGFYTVKAIPAANSAFLTGYAQTYLGDVMTWNAASFLFASPTQPYVANISLIPTNVPSSVGNGSITGTMQQGANKTGSATLAGVHVMLMDANGNIAGHAISDADGNFSFDNLPAGTYTVYVDMMNRQMALMPMTLDASNMAMNGLTVTVHSTQITVDVATSVNNPLADARVSLSPNPVQESATLRMTLTEASAAEVLILNVMGQTVLRTEARLTAGENMLPLSLGNLAPGVYTVQVRANGQQLAVVRLVKE